MKQLLIVDDQELYLKSLQFALKNKFNVFVSTNYDDSIEKLQKQEINLALLDIRLDENDSNNTEGLKILEWIRMNKPDTPVFVMSAYKEFHYAQDALNLGAKHFFRKPIDVMSLMAIMEDKS